MNVNNKKGILVSGNKSKENKSKKVSWGENKITTYLNNNEIESEQNKLMNSLSKISEENSFSFQNNLNDSFNRFSIDNNIINNNNINNKDNFSDLIIGDEYVNLSPKLNQYVFKTLNSIDDYSLKFKLKNNKNNSSNSINKKINLKTIIKSKY